MTAQPQRFEPLLQRAAEVQTDAIGSYALGGFPVMRLVDRCGADTAAPAARDRLTE